MIDEILTEIEGLVYSGVRLNVHHIRAIFRKYKQLNRNESNT
jgi:hypothetical protein